MQAEKIEFAQSNVSVLLIAGGNSVIKPVLITAGASLLPHTVSMFR
jgi:hypothetical protein